MPILTYTSYDQIRAALGVSDEELSDATLGLEVYDLSLVEDLLEVNANLESLYATVNLIPSGSRTPAQQRLWRTTRLYSTFAVARKAGMALSMFGPKEISDGKSSVSRYADAPYKATLANVEAEYRLTQANLKTAYAAVSSSSASATPRTYFAVSSPSIDPVTG